VQTGKNTDKGVKGLLGKGCGSTITRLLVDGNQYLQNAALRNNTAAADHPDR